MQSHQGHFDANGSRSGDAPLPTPSQSSQVAAAQPPLPLIAAAFQSPASNQQHGSVNTSMSKAIFYYREDAQG